jgi:hypothetical protein
MEIGAYVPYGHISSFSNIGLYLFSKKMSFIAKTAEQECNKAI